MRVEKFLQGLGYEYPDRQVFFYIRGAYPFYLFSSFFLMSYFFFFSPEGFADEWGSFYLFTFFLKIALSFALAIIKPSYNERNDAIEKYIMECRFDLQRFRCPHENLVGI